MQLFRTVLLGLLALPSLALAAPPTSAEAIVKRQSNSNAAPTLASGTGITQFQDPARWSQATYCRPQVGQTINGAVVRWAAGDGRDVPRAYVAYRASDSTIVVAHQGTNSSSFSSILNDLDASATAPISQLASCVPAGSLIHNGFQDTWAATGAAILSQVQALRKTYPSARVLLTGHSLGAALSAIDSAYLRCNGISTQTILFGQPRTGNYRFASSLSLLHLGNYADPVIHLPANSDSYWHSAGEYWQNPANSLKLYNCPGYENVNCAWSIKFYEYKTADHLGTYAGVSIPGSGTCPSGAAREMAPLDAFRNANGQRKVASAAA